MTTSQKELRRFVLASMFAAIVIVLALTPLGYIPLPLVKMTIIHIPVIVGSVVLGPRYGALLGGLFGATSLFTNTMTPALTSFTFSPLIPLPGTDHGSWLALIVCFVPRILVGIVPYFVYVGVQKLPFIRKEGNPLSLALAGVLGSLTNTFGVMGLIWLLFRDAYAAANAIEPDAVLGVIMGIVGSYGVPEAIAACVLTLGVGTLLIRMQARAR